MHKRRIVLVDLHFVHIRSVLSVRIDIPLEGIL